MGTFNSAIFPEETARQGAWHRLARLELSLITLKVLHTTTYRFNEHVHLLPHRLMLRPRESRELRLISSNVTVTPPAALTWAHDVFGNTIATATFQMPASNLVIASVAELQLDAVAWPVFDIAVSAMSYPFRYSDDDWTDLGALALPQFSEPAGAPRNWAQMFVRGSRTDTLSLLKDLSVGVSEAVRYQSREDEGTQTPVESLNRGWGHAGISRCYSPKQHACSGSEPDSSPAIFTIRNNGASDRAVQDRPMRGRRSSYREPAGSHSTRLIAASAASI